MSRRARTALTGVALAGLAALTVWAVSGLLPFGTPSGPANAITSKLAHSRQVANAVTGITYDIRGLDTLGEELILFVAALGCAVLLRHRREHVEEPERETGPPVPEALRVAGAMLVGPLIVRLAKEALEARREAVAA